MRAAVVVAAVVVAARAVTRAAAATIRSSPSSWDEAVSRRDRLRLPGDIAR